MAADGLVQERAMRIRPATPGDAEVAARAIYSTGQGILRFLFYADERRTLALLARLAAAPDSEFTYRHTYLAVDDRGEVAGLIHCAPRAERSHTQAGMAQHLIRGLGPWGTLRRMPRFLALAATMRPSAPDAMYIAHVATLPAYRRRGVATQMLAFCQEETARRGLAAMELDAEVDNEAAIRAYTAFGFTIVRTLRSAYLRRAFGFAGAYRMRKLVAP